MPTKNNIGQTTKGFKSKNKLENLLVYQKSKQLTSNVLQYFSQKKLDYRYKFLIQQLFRSISSIGANIAEGYGRLYKKNYRQFLSISRGSCFESQYWLEIANEVGLIDNEMFNMFNNDVIEVIKMLTVMMKKLQQDAG
jgi:four helix bundle protein